MNKRKLASILAICAAVAMFAGCNGGNAASTTTAAETTTTTAAETTTTTTPAETTTCVEILKGVKLHKRLVSKG